MMSKTRKNSKNGSYYVSDGANTIILSSKKLKRQEFTQRKAREAALQLKMTLREKYIEKAEQKNAFKQIYENMFYYRKVRKIMTPEEYFDNKNVLHTIYRFYTNIQFNIYDIELNDKMYNIADIYCTKQYYCDNQYNHHIWTNIHMRQLTKSKFCYYCGQVYDNTTNEKTHIKRLPDIISNLNYINKKKNNVKIILSGKHYILDNKFYWKYVNLNKIWVIKFYPNLHDDIGYLIEKICKMDTKILNECIKNETYNLFYLISTMPLEMRDEIKSYL